MNKIRGAMHVIRRIFGGVDGGTDETTGERKVLRVEGRRVASAGPDRVVPTFGVEGRDTGVIRATYSPSEGHTGA